MIAKNHGSKLSVRGFTLACRKVFFVGVDDCSDDLVAKIFELMVYNSYGPYSFGWYS